MHLLGKKRECGSETGKKREKKRETSRFLPGYDVMTKRGTMGIMRESDYWRFIRCKEIKYDDDDVVSITRRAAKNIVF